MAKSMMFWTLLATMTGAGFAVQPGAGPDRGSWHGDASELGSSAGPR